MKELIEMADEVDLAILSAERGDDVALHARLEEIRDDANKLITKVAKSIADDTETKGTFS